jgi:hypothetical protein
LKMRVWDYFIIWFGLDVRPAVCGSGKPW